MDEISQIYDISRQKLEFLGKLREHYKPVQEKPWSYPDQRQHDKKKVLLIDWITEAIEKIEKDNENLPRLLNDLKASLDVVSYIKSLYSICLLILLIQLFQLRTIEQNELAIIAESNNKAILVFTVVTIIFLPLSFFTVSLPFWLYPS